MSSPDPHTATIFYKVLTEDEFKESMNDPLSLYYGTDFDLSASPRAIHLATSLHTPEVLTSRFADQQSVWVLAIPNTERELSWSTIIYSLFKSAPFVCERQASALDWIGSRSMAMSSGACDLSAGSMLLMK